VVVLTHFKDFSEERTPVYEIFDMITARPWIALGMPSINMRKAENIFRVLQKNMEKEEQRYAGNYTIPSKQTEEDVQSS